MKNPSIRGAIRIAPLFLLLAGCDEQEPDPSHHALADIAKAKPTLTATPPPKGEATSKPVEPAVKPIRRPISDTELDLSPERRGRLEEEHPDAKGFVDLAKLEKKLYGMNLKRGKKAPAIAAFDRHARGKWVLFKGPVAEPTKEGLEFHVRYTPRDPADPFGLTSTWFSVKVESIEGYDPEKYEVGKLAVVLAKYLGNQKASPAFDVVLLEEWFESDG